MTLKNKNDNPFQEWVLPEFEENTATQNMESDLFGRTANWYHSDPEDIAEEMLEQPKPLTLDDIESIRASAYEDGFAEGKETGFQQGVEEGKLIGLAEGHQEGLTQGLEQGLSEGKIDIETQTLHWQQLVSRLHRPLEKLDNNVEFQLVKLATNLAEQISRCEVSVNPQVVLQALKQAVEALPVTEQTIVISLHPEDLIFVENAFSTTECNKRGWDVRAEPTLLRGDCHVHTQTSSIDYTFSNRVDQVLKHFLKENYQHCPAVSDDGDISNDQPLDYQIRTKQDLMTEHKLALEDPDDALVTASADLDDIVLAGEDTVDNSVTVSN